MKGKRRKCEHAYCNASVNVNSPSRNSGLVGEGEGLRCSAGSVNARTRTRKFDQSLHSTRHQFHAAEANFPARRALNPIPWHLIPSCLATERCRTQKLLPVPRLRRRFGVSPTLIAARRRGDGEWGGVEAAGLFAAAGWLVEGGRPTGAGIVRADNVAARAGRLGDTRGGRF